MQLVVLFTICLATSVVVANPAAVERAFRRYIDSNACLSACMQPVQASQRDVAIFKQSNFADYILHLDDICATIETARSCIDACGERSNPFALRSVTLICSTEGRRAAAQLGECLINEGASVHAECESTCGSSYEKIHEQLRAASATAKSDNAVATRALTQLSGDACSSLKCTSRCAVATYNTRCASIDGERAGDAIRRLVETMLVAHRDDLLAQNLLETAIATSAPQCNYHYAPLALFNPQHDRVVSPIAAAPMPTTKIDADAAQRLALVQLQARVLEKQVEVLDKMARNLDSDNEKSNFKFARFLFKPRSPLYASAPAFF